MAELSATEMRRVIAGILEGADLTTLSSKKIRKYLEEKYNTDFTDRKKEIDNVVMELVTAQQEKEASNGKSYDSEANSSDSETVTAPKRAKVSEHSVPKQESIKKKEKDDSDEEDDEELARKLHDEEIRSRSRAVKKPSKKGTKKEPKPAKTTGAKRESSYSRKCALSAELSVVVGAEQMARHDVVKKMWEIFRERNLVDPSNKQFAFCDEQLHKVFGQKRVRMFGMMKYLKNHIKDIK
ncbi:uncharacterized protein LOC135377332 isoform X2 [Ornithodoros turicata]|uniref:uncharacterized protein LOC135377332 isoform X2 n=1 Tax=Ornithodoros turicata TaxID=34597 RepID=UPI003139E38A